MHHNLCELYGQHLATGERRQQGHKPSTSLHSGIARKRSRAGKAGAAGADNYAACIALMDVLSAQG